MSTDTAKLKSLPAPRPGQTFGTADVRRKTVSNGHAKRPLKGLAQFNVKIRARARERFEALHASLDAQGVTKGELLERMIDTYVRAAGGQSAPAADVAAGRTTVLDVYATPELADALHRRATRQSWSLSATIENACAVAADVEERA